jgi:hypothetical protein
MGFKKGNNFGGRTEGAKNKKTIAWEQFEDFMLNDGLTRAKQIIENSTDKEFISYYFQLMEYFKPKQRRTEFKDETDNTIHVTFIDN